jgi:CubicO group peptidase (beta-lactamase class C family)
VEAGVRPPAPLRSEPEAPVPVPELLARFAVPGASVAVFEGGRLAWARGYGVLEAGRAVPVTPESIFQVCSISKPVAAVAALRLVGEGRLDLDADVNESLRAWRLPPNGGWAPRVTLRHLLSHTAGLTGNWYRGFRRGAPAPTLLQVLRGEPPANTPPVRAVLVPGTRFRYSGSHYSVLQQLLVDVTGAPFPDLARELVFAPLGMADSSYDQAFPEARPESAAVGHQIGGEPVPGGWRVLPEMAGAGLWTTPADLARLLLDVQRAHAGEAGRVLTPAVAREALTAQPGGWGLGFALEGTGATRRFGHGGDNIGYKCRMTAYVGTGRGAVVTTNGDDGDLVHEALLRAVAAGYGWPDFPGGGEAAHEGRPPDDGAAAGAAGTYRTAAGLTLTVEARAGALWLTVGEQAPLAFDARPGGGFGARHLNADLALERDPAGAVAALTLTQEGEALTAGRLAPRAQ